jgi:hypothetical protein
VLIGIRPTERVAVTDLLRAASCTASAAERPGIGLGCSRQGASCPIELISKFLGQPLLLVRLIRVARRQPHVA